MSLICNDTPVLMIANAPSDFSNADTTWTNPLCLMDDSAVASPNDQNVKSVACDGMDARQHWYFHDVNWLNNGVYYVGIILRNYHTDKCIMFKDGGVHLMMLQLLLKRY